MSAPWPARPSTAARAYLEAWGKPVAFYSDKHGVFRVNHPSALGGDGMTQFGRALRALNIDIICANSSPAKGRVERAHKTLQDRLVKELRLAGVRTLAAGNALLPAFRADYNTRFAKPPANTKDLHRPLRAGDDLWYAFAWKEERTLSPGAERGVAQPLFMRASGASAIFSSCLPKFSPVNRRLSVCGAFSSPIAMSSFCLSLPSASQPARASIASGNRAA
jgi:hypothetical protein